MKNISPKQCFLFCNMAGFGLLFAFWLDSGETAGFFLLLFLVVMSLLRWRMPRLNFTVVLDIIACLAMSLIWQDAAPVLALVLFAAMYFGFYWAAVSGAYLFLNFHPILAILMVLAALCGVFLGLWRQERWDKLKDRDKSAGKYYQMESLQSDLTAALAQVERMTAVAERTRIARDIHDNAGHEIVAAYISLQTARDMMETENPEALELYDAAMERLNTGTDKIRQTVHNLAAVTALGVETLQEICHRFPVCGVAFRAYGDTSKIPMYVWNILEACLNESLTNVARHSSAKYVSVDLDVARHIVRLCVENDGGAKAADGLAGSGLRNLRHRAVAIGGSLSVDAGEVFRVICVIPIKEGE